ncbi:histidine kinase [Actinoallomurus acanthiterrae]
MVWDGAMDAASRFTARTAHVMAVASALVCSIFDVLLFVLGQRTDGILGPAAGLCLSLIADLSVLWLIRSPRAVASIALAVSAARAVGELVAPGTLTPVHPLARTVVPTCAIVIIWVIVTVRPIREALSFTAAFALLGAQPWQPSALATPTGIAATLVPAALAYSARARVQLMASLRTSLAAAEREQHLLAEQAVAAERRRLATDMHDVVTHHVTEMVLHAGALKLTSESTDVRTSAEQIRAAGEKALGELRELIGVLHGDGRRDSEPAPRPSGTSDPAEDIGDLVRAACESGGTVTLELRGVRRPMTAAIARTAVRVVQESLSNARKHAPGASVHVGIDYGGQATIVSIRDSGGRHPDPSLAGSGSGLGLVGLRRRVELIGGEFSAGELQSGGWQVTASLPDIGAGATARPGGDT